MAHPGGVCNVFLLSPEKARPAKRTVASDDAIRKKSVGEIWGKRVAYIWELRQGSSCNQMKYADGASCVLEHRGKSAMDRCSETDTLTV